MPRPWVESDLLLPDGGETSSREMRQWTYVVGNASKDRETTLAVVCRERAVRRVRKKEWHEIGQKKERITFMIVECELELWAQVPNVDSLVVATIDIAPEATMSTAMRLSGLFAHAALENQVRVVGGDFGKAFWCVGPELEKRGIRADVAAWFPWVDTIGAMRCLSDTVGIFLLGGCHGAHPLFSPKILTSAMAELDGVPKFESLDGQKSGLQLSQFWHCGDEG